MPWQWWCACLGLIFVAAGAALAFIGFRKTWSDFVINERFWRALTSWLPRWWGKAREALVAAYNRLVRHKKFVRAADRGTAVAANAPVGWKVLPLDFPEDEKLLEVVRRLWRRQSNLELRLGNNIRLANQSAAAAQEDLGKRVAVVDEKVVKVAVGGLSLQAWGLILVTGGTALSSVPALAQVSSPDASAPARAAPVGHAAAYAAVQASGSVWATDVPGWITAVGTAVLAGFAIVTAVYAVRAFRKQSKEVSDQAEMLQVQSDRLELQERQFEDQRKINQKRDELFDKQLRESEQRTMILERQQAEMINVEPGSTERGVPGLDPATDDTAWTTDAANRSRRPIRNVVGRIEAAVGAPAQEASLSGVYAEFPPSPFGPPGGAGRRALIDPPAKPRIILIRAGETGAFLFPVGARLNPDARVTVRFTDDAGLHWQIDPDLHLEKLPDRDDW